MIATKLGKKMYTSKIKKYEKVSLRTFVQFVVKNAYTKLFMTIFR